MYRKRWYHKNSYRRSEPDLIDSFFNLIDKIIDKKSSPKTRTSDSHYENNQKYDLKQSLLTPAETNFSKVLEEVVGNRYRIEHQVQLSRIINVRDSNANFTNYHDFNPIKAKSVDFVLFDENMKPKVAIELDDSSHQRPDRIKRDEFVNKLMSQIGLRLIRIPNSYSYDKERLASQIFPQY